MKKFNELSKYAPYLIDIEAKKNDKFIEALGHYLSKSVLVSKNEPFSRVVDLALKFERKEKNYQAEKLTRARGSEVNRGGSQAQQKDAGKSGNRYKPYDQGQRGQQNQRQGNWGQFPQRNQWNYGQQNRQWNGQGG